MERGYLARMNLYDLPPGYDDPVDWLLGFHRRMERQLAALGRLHAELDAYGIGPHAARTAQGILECLGHGARLHHADEEHDLLPLVDRRLSSEERQAFGFVRARLAADHREMERTWRAIRRPLEAVAEGIPRVLPTHEVGYYRAVAAAHISYEEGAVHLLVVRHLQTEDLAFLSRRMRERRVRGQTPNASGRRAFGV
jgi:pyridoxamine 5'-phosphate oxidase